MCRFLCPFAYAGIYVLLLFAATGCQASTVASTEDQSAVWEACPDWALLRFEFYNLADDDGTYLDLDFKVRNDGVQPGISGLSQIEPMFVLSAEGMEGSDWDNRSVIWNDDVRKRFEGAFDRLFSPHYFLLRYRGNVLLGGYAVQEPYASLFVDSPMMYVDNRFFFVEEGLRIGINGPLRDNYLFGIAGYSRDVEHELYDYFARAEQCSDR